MRNALLIFFLLGCLAGSGQGQRSIVSGRALSAQKLRADIDLLEQALTQLHPGIYRYATPKQIERIFDALRNKLRNGISEAEFLRRLAQTVAKIRCGHTYPNPWNMREEMRDRLYGGASFLPIGFQVVGRQMFITHNASDHEDIRPGAELLSINGVPSHTIIDSLTTIARYDGNNASPVAPYLSLQNFEPDHWEAFDMYFPLFFPFSSTSVRLEYRNFTAPSKATATVKALKKQRRAERMAERYDGTTLNRDAWSLTLNFRNLAVLRLGTFAIWDWEKFDYKSWFERAFTMLDSMGVDHLVVDIRGNGGGLGGPKDELLRYLTDRPITCKDVGPVLIRCPKVPSELTPHIETWDLSYLKGLSAEAYTRHNKELYRLTATADCRDLLPARKRFRGQIYLFGGPSNVSGTFTLLEKSKQLKLAKLIGATSGGNQQGINGGHYSFFYLPYSQMEIDIPMQFYAPAKPRPDAGIEPNVALAITQADIAYGRDTYMKFVRNQVGIPYDATPFDRVLLQADSKTNNTTKPSGDSD